MLCPQVWWRLSVSLLPAPPCNPSLRLSSSLSPPPPPPPQMGNKSNAPLESGPEHPKGEAYLNTVIAKRIALFESIKSEQIAEERERERWWRLSVSLLRAPPCNPSLRLFSPLSLPPPPPMGNKSKAPPESSPEHPKDEAYLNTVISKLISIFESIKSEQLAQLQSLSGDLIKITLPDGSVKEGKKWILTPLDIAKEISKSLAANALISKVNGVLWDIYRPFEGDCDLKGSIMMHFMGTGLK